MTLTRTLSPLALGFALVPLACADGDSRETADNSASGQVTSATMTGVTVTATATMTAGDGTMGEPTDGGSVSDSDSQGTSNGPTADDTSDAETGIASAETTNDPTNDPSTSSTDPTNETTNNPETTDSESDTDSCAEVKVEAENIKQPADIIFVIDNSGSMDFEEAAVQSNMNDFSNKIVASGIDAHVVLLSNYNICIEPPLGTGLCPGDSKLPEFLHVDVSIGSNDPLSKLIEKKPDWEASMRPDGFKHVVIVSDDDSDLAAGTFNDMFKAFGPEYTNYKLHAIVGLWDFEDFGKCAGDPFCCATIAAEGEEYKDLTGATGGVLGALCDNGKQDFGALFDTLSMQVVQDAKIACEWVIPDPMGMDIDFNKVNVDYNDGMNPALPIPKVDDMAACMDLQAWYYDDPMNPTKIFACPALCTKIQGNPMAQVDVKFGCESIVPQ